MMCIICQCYVEPVEDLNLPIAKGEVWEKLNILTGPNLYQLFTAN